MSSRQLKTVACLNPGRPLREGPPDAVDCRKIEPLYRRFFGASLYTLRHQTFAGGWTPPIEREVYERGHAVAILPYDPRTDRLVLIEQFRIGALVAGWHPWVVEIAAGIIEPGESPDEVARRETREETGLAVQRLEFVAHLLSTPGGSSETVAVYCAEVDATKAPEHGGLVEETEDIRVFTMPVDEALAAMDRGSVNNACTFLALQWLALNRDSLRRRWLNDKETPR